MAQRPTQNPEICLQVSDALYAEAHNADYRTPEEAAKVAVDIGKSHLLQHALDESLCGSSDFAQSFGEAAISLKQTNVGEYYLKAAKRLRRHERINAILFCFAAQYSLEIPPYNNPFRQRRQG